MDCHEVEGRLHAYLEQEVLPQEDGRIKSHLALCGRCKGHAEALDGMTLALFPSLTRATGQRLERDILQALPGRRLLRRPGVVAGAVALVLIALFGAWILFGGDDRPTRGSRGWRGPRRAAGRRVVGTADRASRTRTGLETRVEIRGRVIDGDDRPVEGVVIRASLLDGDPAPERWNATTDREGLFWIPDVDRPIFLEVVGDGFVSQHHALPEVSSWITEGRERHDMVLRMVRAGEIVGTVLDEAGIPVGGARVQYRREQGRAWSFRRSIPRGEGETQSAADGSYRLRSIPRALSLRVVWIHPHYALAWTDPFQLEEEAREVRRDTVLAPGGSVWGEVVDSRGLLRSGADVRLLPIGGGEPHPVWDRTGADGRFRVDFLALGDWELQVGFGTLTLWKGEVRITPEEREVEVRVQLQKEEAGPPAPTGTVLGRAVPLEGGQPLEGVEVHAQVDGLDQSVRAGPTGAFRLQGPAGLWRVEVSSPGRSVVVWEGLRVSEGGEVDLGEVFLPAEGVIQGRLETSDGGGVSGAEVTVLDAAGQPVPVKTNGSWGLDQAIRTASDGSFDVRGLTEGNYWVVIWHPELGPAAQLVRGMSAGGEVTIRLETPLERRIKFQGPDGNPAVPLKLELYLPDGPLLWRGHPDSTSLTLHLAPGEYIAVVEGSPGVEFRHDLAIAEEEEPKPILLSVP